ncbi:MAG TPA: hypothetical protein PK587_13570 [Syntrophales bacterium]|nr:hypothetical protein [Syntrophales bacterium]
MEQMAANGISDAIGILFHLLYFVLIMLGTSVFLDRIWAGRSQWIVLPLVAASILLFSVYPGLLLGILKSVTGPVSIGSLVVIAGFGVLAGMVMASL